MNSKYIASTFRFLIACLVIQLGSLTLKAATPADINFDIYSGTGISSRVIGDWQFRLLDALGEEDNLGGDFVDIIDSSTPDITGLASGADRALFLEGTLELATEAQIRSRFGDPFSLVSFHIDGSDTTYRITGYLGGLPVVGATQSVDSAVFVDTTITFTNALFQNIDEFRISREDGSADISLFIDDIDVSAAVPSSANPVIGNLTGDSVIFLEGSPAVRLDSGTGATITDSDSADFHGGAIVVSISSGRIPPQDVLSITNQGTGATQVGVSGTNITYEGTLVGSFTGGTSYDNLMIFLNNSASKTAAAGILRALTYYNTATGVPIAGARGITIRVYDGDGGYAVATTTVTVQQNNYAPTVTTAFGTNAFNEGINEPSIAIVVDETAAAADPDSATLASGTVTIIRNFNAGEDVLLFTNAPSTMGNITGSYDTNSGILTLTSDGASATVTNWSAALRAVYYSNTSENPSTTTRTITFSLNDGADVGVGNTNFVSVASFNDAPENTIPAGVIQSAVDAPVTFSALAGTAIAVSDADAGNNSIQVSLTCSTGTVSLASITGLSFVTGTGTDDEIVGFTGTIADINAALDGAVYTPPSGHDGTASILVFTSDLGNSGTGGFLSDSDTIELNFDNTPPAPPVFTSVSDDTGTDGDLLTADTTLILHGTAESNTVVTITRVGTGVIGSTNANASGNWSFDYRGTLLPVGTNVFNATATDEAGNTSAASADFEVVVFDDIVPTIDSITRGGSSPTFATNVTFLVAFSEPITGIDVSDFALVTSGTATGEITSVTQVGAFPVDFEVTVVNVTGDGTLRLDLNDAGTGITDLAGQPIATGFTNGEVYEIDNILPGAPAITAISEDTGVDGDFLTVDATLVLSGTAEASSIVTLTRVGTGIIGTTNADGSGAWSFDYTGTVLPDGTNVFTVTATDAAGNISPASSAVSVVISPSLSLSFLSTPALYVAKKPAIKVDTSATLDAGARADLADGQLVVSIATNGTLNDVLSLYTATNSAQGISLVDTNVLWGDLLVATITRGHAITNPLTFTFTTNATPSAVQALVREISFATTDASKLARTLRFDLSDGFGSEAPSAYKTVLINTKLKLPGVDGFFTNSIGTFNGLVLRTNDVVVSEAGYFLLKTTTTLKFSGYVLIAGKKTSFSGQFNTNGEASVVTSGSKAGIDLQLSEDSGVVRGRVTSYALGGWTSDLVGCLTAVGTTANAAVTAGAYTLLLPSSSDPEVGSGWATITFDAIGKAKLKGSLGDNQKWSFSSYVCTNGQWPVYASVDKKQGAILGWLSVSNTTPATIGGTLTWLKPVSAPYFTNGIAAELDVTGSRYTAPAGTNAILSWTNGLLSLANGNLPAPLTNALNITTLGKLVGNSGSISNLKFSISAKAGSFSGSFRHPATGKTTKYSGVLLQSEDIGGGYFLGTNSSGVLRLESAE